MPSSDLVGMLLPAIPVDPVGLWGTLSPSDSDPAGQDGPYVTGGPVGHIGTLSPSTPVVGLPHLARVCRYRARVHRLPACCCRLVAWYGAELERDGIREASLRYGTMGLPASNARAPAVSACLPPSAQ